MARDSEGQEFLIYKEKPYLWGVLMFFRHTKGDRRWNKIRKSLRKELRDDEVEALKRITGLEQELKAGSQR